MEIHPYAARFPMMSPEELDQMAESIRKDGLIHPILTFRGEVIDGRNRLRACELAGIRPSFKEWDGGEDQSPTGLILSLNINARRHLNSAQKAALAVEALPFFEAEAAQRQIAGQKHGGETAGRGRAKDSSTQKVGESNRHQGEAAAQAARYAKTNRGYVSLLKKVKEEDPERFERVKDGKETIAEARRSRLIKVRRGGKAGRKTKAGKSRRVLSDGTSKRRKIVARTHDAVIRLAEKGRPLSETEVARIAGYSSFDESGSSSVDKFLIRCQFIPWLEIQTSQPQNEILRHFIINENLKAICEDQRVQPRLGTSILKLAIHLREELLRRLDEMQDRTRRTRWNPDSIAKVELIGALQYALDQLELITNPNLHADDEVINISSHLDKQRRDTA